jgi:hypothetical protein
MDPLTPAGIRIVSALDSAAQRFKRDILVTCGREAHPPTDPHSRGEALDIRTLGWPEMAIVSVYNHLREHLGAAFTVLYEVKVKPNGVLGGIAYVNPDATAEHIHIQTRKGTTFPDGESESAV